MVKPLAYRGLSSREATTAALQEGGAFTGSGHGQ